MQKELFLTASVAVNTLKAVVLGACLSMSVGLGVNATPSADRAPADQVLQVDGYTRTVHQAMKEHRCSTTGFAANTVPPTALIRTNHGRLRIVTFMKGWAVYNGKRPGTLVAVCRDAPPQRSPTPA